MPTSVTLNGTNYDIPLIGEGNWGTTVSNFLIAVTTGVLQKTGGNFTLTAAVNFGDSFGVTAKNLTLKNAAADNAASAGLLRLANAASIAWRNAANSANITFGIDSSDEWDFNGTTLSTAELGYLAGVTSAIQTQLDAKASTASLTAHTGASTGVHGVSGSVVGTSDAQTLTNKTIDSDNNTITNIVDADIKAAAAIALNKLAATTASRALVSDGSGFVSASAVTATELGYLTGVTSAIQTQLTNKAPGTGSSITADRALISNGSGQVTHSSVTTTEVGYLSGVTSAIQTQLDSKGGVEESLASSSPSTDQALNGASSSVQVMTPTADINVDLDNTTTAILEGRNFTIVNLATAYTITLRAADNSTIASVGPGSTTRVIADQDSPAVSTDWALLVNPATSSKAGTISREQATTFELDSQFTGGELTVNLYRLGNIVIMSGQGEATHSSGSTISTSAGVVPSDYRPSFAARNVYSAGSSRVNTVFVNTDGSLNVTYTDDDGAVNSTNTAGAIFAFWVINS